MADHLRRRHFLGRDHLLERHHLAAPRARIQLAQRLRVRPELLLGLDVDAVGPVVELEVVHVLRAEQDLHRAGDLVERQPSASARWRSIVTCSCGSFAVNVLNRPRTTPDWLPPAQWPGSLRQVGDVLSGLIEDLELEPAEPAQAGNRRRARSRRRSRPEG